MKGPMKDRMIKACNFFNSAEFWSKDSQDEQGEAQSRGFPVKSI